MKRNQTTHAGTAGPGTAGFDSLLRHFVDLRDGTHGGAVGRAEKERLFGRATDLLDRPAREVLSEVDRAMLLGTGDVDVTGVVAAPDGGLMASWSLTWPEQRATGVRPITIEASYGRGFHHPHLRGSTLGEWPLNVFTVEDADRERSTLRAIAVAELHNIVFLRDHRIVPTTTRGRGGL